MTILKTITFTTLAGILALAAGCMALDPDDKNEGGAPAASGKSVASAAPLTAPKNPFAADSTQALPHGDPAQQDATYELGPVDVTRQLEPDELKYVHLGPGYIGGFVSSPYPDGRRVMWTNGVNGLYKIDADNLEVFDHLPTPQAKVWTEEYAEKSIAALDADNGLSKLRLAGKNAAALKDLSGIYIVIGNNFWSYVADKTGLIKAYGDTVKGDPESKIEEKGRFQLPPGAAGNTLGMNITYDGWIIVPTEQGWLVAISMDMKEHHLIKLQNPDNEDTSNLQRVGYGWVRNSLALDDEGGIYIASRNYMHKVIWTGSGFSSHEGDGAWVAKYSNNLGIGTGATPSLMGFGEEDRFVVITDGDELMNVALFWRDEIPDDWETLPGAPSRRIAGFAPASMGELNLAAVQTEQSVVVAGYGAMVVNNTPRNAPPQLPPRARSLLVGGLGSNPQFQPYGVQKFEWNPETRSFAEDWTNTKVSSPNGVPYVSLGSQHVYFIGARNNKWTLEAVNWDTGESTFYYVIGGQRYNSQYSSPIPDGRGGMVYGTTWGRARIVPTQP